MSGQPCSLHVCGRTLRLLDTDAGVDVNYRREGRVLGSDGRTGKRVVTAAEQGERGDGSYRSTASDQRRS